MWLVKLIQKYYRYYDTIDTTYSKLISERCGSKLVIYTKYWYKNITVYDNILDFRILKWSHLLWLLYLNDCQARTLPQAPVTGFTGLLFSPTQSHKPGHSFSLTLYLPDPMTYLADEWTGQPQVEHKVTTLNRETTRWPHCLLYSSIDSTGQPPWQLDQYWSGPDDCWLVL